MTQRKLANLLTEIRGCEVCAAHFDHAPNPVLRAHTSARLMLIGQAPGRRVHESGIPWEDASGNTLRDWLQLSREQFYDDRLVAIVPSGFCFPGSGKSGDLPPRPECAPLWHERLLALLPNIKLTLLIGTYAQALYLKDNRKPTLTETVAAYEEYLPRFFPLPHPSPRNRPWLKHNAWFEKDLLPVLQQAVFDLGK
jgi:uracil-DNA glycosylase